MDQIQAQRADILRDSLDELPENQGRNEEKKEVLDENGKLVQVIFDPILKCYYEPSRNLYYEVKDVERS